MQFQPHDDSANGLLDYAVGTLGVTHGRYPSYELSFFHRDNPPNRFCYELTASVIVVGHTGCGGCVAAWNAPAPSSQSSRGDSPLSRLLDPVVRLRHTLAEGSKVDDLIKENVKVSVRNIVASDVSFYLRSSCRL